MMCLAFKRQNPVNLRRKKAVYVVYRSQICDISFVSLGDIPAFFRKENQVRSIVVLKERIGCRGKFIICNIVSFLTDSDRY